MGVLAQAEQEGQPSIIGPHAVAIARVVELSEIGDWLGDYPQRTVSVLLIDLAEGATAALEVLEEGLAQHVPLSESSPMHLPG